MPRRRKPKNYYGCAFDISARDKRQPEWERQRSERGFDNTELWNLDHVICMFVAPRLREFAKGGVSFPASLTEKKWQKILDEMVVGFDLMEQEDAYYGHDKEQRAKMDRAWKLFTRWHGHLWN